VIDCLGLLVGDDQRELLDILARGELAGRPHHRPTLNIGVHFQQDLESLLGSRLAYRVLGEEEVAA